MITIEIPTDTGDLSHYASASITFPAVTRSPYSQSVGLSGPDTSRIE